MKNLFISIIILTFAKGIVGGHDPMTRELSTSPFPFFKVDVINKKLENMTKRKTTLEVKSDFHKVWGNKYDYSLIEEYQNNKKKLPIVCKKHGIFQMSANEHLRGCGCPKCANERTGERCRYTKDVFIDKAKAIHGQKFCYDLVEYLTSRTPVELICNRGHHFMVTPHDHLSGRGCPICKGIECSKRQTLSTKEFVERAKKVWGNLYDYSSVNYKGKGIKVSIGCSKHGLFLQEPSNHIQGHGCPYCKRSLGEERIAKFLQEQGILFNEQHRIKNENIFCINKIIIVDFFLPLHNIIIEYNGVQHFKESPLFDARTFEQQQERDNAIRQYCREHDIRLVEIPYTEYNNIEPILGKIKSETNYG